MPGTAPCDSTNRAILASGSTCVAYETLADDQGRLPLLTPMSEVAGRMSIQEGAKYLERPQQGRGILLAGVPGVAPAHITILGGGIVCANAAKIAAGFRADVAILDINMERLRYLESKVYWLSGILGNSKPVWIADPRDAQYLNTTEADLLRMAGHEAAEGMMSIDGEYAAATPALMARAAQYEAARDAALNFTKPQFNESMRSGHANM